MIATKLTRFLMVVVYFSAAVGLIALGWFVIKSGFEGYLWYQAHLAQLLPIPSLELYQGTGGFMVVVGVLLVIAGFIEIMYCPTCPFPLHRKWESPTLKDKA